MTEVVPSGSLRYGLITRRGKTALTEREWLLRKVFEYQDFGTGRFIEYCRAAEIAMES